MTQCNNGLVHVGFAVNFQVNQTVQPLHLQPSAIQRWAGSGPMMSVYSEQLAAPFLCSSKQKGRREESQKTPIIQFSNSADLKIVTFSLCPHQATWTWWFKRRKLKVGKSVEHCAFLLTIPWSVCSLCSTFHFIACSPSMKNPCELQMQTTSQSWASGVRPKHGLNRRAGEQ